MSTFVMPPRLPGTATTVTIAGRSFPIAGLVCPPDDMYPDRSDRDRSLGTGNDPVTYIPAENGVIFAVERDSAPIAPPATLRLGLLCAICEQSYDPEGWIWLPTSVLLSDGRLTPWPTFPRPRSWGVSDWYGAEPDWVVETIDRLSRLPFTEPAGPRCVLVRRDQFDAPSPADPTGEGEG